MDVGGSVEFARVVVVQVAGIKAIQLPSTTEREFSNVTKISISGRRTDVFPGD